MQPPPRSLRFHPHGLLAPGLVLLLLSAAAFPAAAQIVSEPSLKRAGSAVIVQPIRVSTTAVPNWPDPPAATTSPHEKTFPTGPAGSSSGPAVRDPSGAGTQLAGPVVAAVPVIGASWPGIGPNSGLPPPDPAMAVGPNHIVAALNDDFAIFTKAGVNLVQIDFNIWFGSEDQFFDPKCAYDHPAQRYVCIVLRKRESEKKSWWSLMASDDNNPVGIWHLYNFDATVDGKTPNGLWVDYPYLGFDQSAIYLTGNMASWPPDPVNVYAKLRIIDKWKVYNGLGTGWWDIWDFQSGAASCGSTRDRSLAPAQVMDTSVPAEYILSTEGCGGNTLTMRRITQPLNWVAGPTLTTELIQVNAYTLPPAVKQPEIVPGTPVTLSQMPNYLGEKVILRGGHLYAAFTAGYQWSGDPAPRAVLRLYDLLPQSVPTVIARQSQFGNPGFDYYQPSAAPTSTQDMVIGFGRSSDVNNEFPGQRYTVWPAGGALLGSKNVKKGTGSYTNKTWGDYFAVHPDPSDPDNLWFVGEHSLGGTSWGTWVAEIQVP